MSELPISSPYRSTPEAAVSDAEREQLSARLNTAYADGKLDADDYRARLDTLFAAQRMGELVPVVTGLPAAATYAEPAIVASSPGRPGELAPARSGNGLTVLAVGGAALVLLLIVILVIIVL